MKTVFAVDDDKAFVGTLGKILAERDYAIAYSPRVLGAFEKMKEMRPDLVFLDVMLPDGAGYQVSRRIRMDREVYKTPVLFISAINESPEVEYAMEQGGDLYLAKPFTLEQLLNRISMLESLASEMGRSSVLSGLPGREAFYRELDFRLLRGWKVALCLLTLESFREYCSIKGKEGGERALALTAKLLKEVVKDCEFNEVFLAHPGDFHFLAILQSADAERFCEKVSGRFEEQRAVLYKDFELKDGYIVVTKERNVYAAYPLMKLKAETIIPKPGDNITAHSLAHHLVRVLKHTDHEVEKTLFRWDLDVRF
jgi:CheY-like chemotaxis protein